MHEQKESDFFLECKDHTVSGEVFNLYLDPKYEMLVTVPKPSLKNLGKYYESEEYISHTDAKRSFLEKMYHIVKSYTLKRKTTLISALVSDSKSLLDIGAGTGDFLIEAKKRNWKVQGSEPNESARLLAEKKGVILKETTRDFEDNSYDVITMWHVLEHVSNLKEQLAELKRLLKPGGHVIIAVPNFKSYDAHYYGSYWAAYDVPRHLWHFSRISIEKLFLEEKMILKKVLPMKFDSFYVSILSEKYKTGKSNYFWSFWIGMISNLKGIGSKEYSSHIYIIKKQ